MQRLNVCYVGHDERFFKELVNSYQTIDHQKRILLTSVDDNQYDCSNALVDQVLGVDPRILIVDLSSEKNKPILIKLSEFMAQTASMYQGVTIGLVSRIPSRDDNFMLFENGIDLVECKKPELSEFVYIMLNLVSGYRVEMPSYYTINPNIKLGACFPLRIGFCHEKSIHVETDIYFPIGENITIISNYYPAFESFTYRIDKRAVVDIYYNHQYSYELSHNYEYSLERDFDSLARDYKKESQRKEKRYLFFELKKRLERLKLKKDTIYEQYRKWIAEKSPVSMPKKYRVSVIDDSMSLFNTSKENMDVYPFSIRIHKYLTNLFIQRTSPEIIVWVFSSTNNLRELKRLKKLVDRAGLVDPFLIVFNSPLTDIELQKEVPFKQVIVDVGSLTLDLVVHYYALLKKSDLGFEEERTNKRVYFDKTMNQSLALINHDILIKKINELYLDFECTLALKKGIRFYVAQPVPIYIYIISRRKLKGKYLYRGHIFGLEYSSLKKLRSFINQKRYLT